MNIETIYLTTGNGLPEVKITDYGLARVKNECRQRSVSNFMAPEIFFQNLYGEKCDLWSLGCVIYYLHTRRFAFPQIIEELTDWLKRKCLPSYEEYEWNNSKDLKDVVNKLIVFDQIERIDLIELCGFEYIKNLMENSVVDK